MQFDERTVGDYRIFAGALEAHYWSRSPVSSKIMRGIATMTEETRAVIEVFVALARDTQSVTASLDPRGK